jgi:16S rRNA processing protein RimM
LNDPVEKDSLLPIGKIAGTHGVKGNLKIISYAENLSVFKRDGLVLIRTPSGKNETYVVKWAAPYKRGGLLSLEGITGCDQAKLLVGSEVLINRSALPELEKGTFYWFELIGLSVWTADDALLGRITSIMQTGSNDVYVVKNDDDKEILVPALESVILEIDPEKQTMRVNLPEGL